MTTAEKRREYARKWRAKNREHIRAREARYRETNSRAEYCREYDRKNKKARRAYAREYRRTHPQLKIKALLRSRIYNAIKNQRGWKTGSSQDLLGAPYNTVRNHLEQLFSEGMSWDNQGEWHIDHIKPCSSFNLTDPEEQKKCFHYTNLQPLWASDNLQKGST